MIVLTYLASFDMADIFPGNLVEIIEEFFFQILTEIKTENRKSTKRNFCVKSETNPLE